MLRNPDSISKLLIKLDYQRENVHLIGDELSKDINTAIELLEAMEKENSNKLPVEAADLCKQVGIYYAFHVRNKELAVKYFRKYAKFPRADKEMLLGYAHMLDDNYQDVSHFENALGLPEDWEDLGNQQDKTPINTAFAMRHLGLIFHRKSLGNNTAQETAEYNREARQMLEHAIVQLKFPQETITSTSPIVLLDLAESNHVLGIILSQQNDLAGALKAFQEAYAIWGKFCDASQGLHPMIFTTMQLLGNVFSRIGEHESALELLTTTLDIQYVHYLTDKHPEIAKTHYYLGEAYTAKSKPVLALKEYQDALLIQQTLSSPDSSFIKTTLSAMLKSLSALPHFDWNDVTTIQLFEKSLVERKKALKEIANTLALINDTELLEFAELLLEIGTYFNHVKRDPESALEYLSLAETIFKNHSVSRPISLAWTANHIAYSYQQSMAAKKKQYDAAVTQRNEGAIEAMGGSQRNEQAAVEAYRRNEQVISGAKEILERNEKDILEICRQLIHEFEKARDDASVRVKAFAYCIKANIQSTVGKTDEAIASYRKALDLYESIGRFDDQYARVTTRYAALLIERPDPEKVFSQLSEYWNANKDAHHPYPARFFYTYGKFLLKLAGKSSQPLPHLKKAEQNFYLAQQILESTEGKEATFTQKVTKKLSDTRDTISRLTNTSVSSAKLYKPEPEKQSPAKSAAAATPARVMLSTQAMRALSLYRR
jgi:tetratricopeptide (TPR) repeat protein